MRVRERSGWSDRRAGSGRRPPGPIASPAESARLSPGARVAAVRGGAGPVHPRTPFAMSTTENTLTATPAGAVADRPLVSVVIATRDRPRLLSIALACYQHQTYANRELIVVDDGLTAPADASAVEAAGGRLIRVEPGTSLGTKLNRGVQAARGRFCQKMDDDDWYAPTFIETMVRSVHESWTVVRRPTLAVLMANTTLYVGPKAPPGAEKNWLATVPGRGFFAILRLYAPAQAAIDGSWKPGDIERIQP